ncbi:hypothetical protein ACFL6M_06725 [Candidatus Eisenbacteria bacterium]|uniref:Uncharacterized protein n=1 Tax=Eiseniibacteriota bacterium TaxID=2212470 RepID=A0ABV6YLR9_UNCEI
MTVTWTAPGDDGITGTSTHAGQGMDGRTGVLFPHNGALLAGGEFRRAGKVEASGVAKRDGA